MNSVDSPQPRWRRHIKPAIKWSLAVVILFAVGQKVWNEKQRLAEYEVELDWVLLATAGVLYIAGLSLSGMFWWVAMRDAGARPEFFRTMSM